MAISRHILDILACTKCKGQLRPAEKEEGLICEKCGLLYRVQDGIPVMLVEQASSLEK